MKNLLPILAITSIFGSCALVPYAAAAAVGIWSYDEYSDEGGEIVVETTPARAWEAAKGVARSRGTDLEIAEAPRRITCRIDEADILIEVLPFQRTLELAEIKVSARQLIRGRADIARNIAADIAAKL
jgi:hypothetical protein